MEPSCVRQTDIPGTSALFGDYLYRYDRVSQFYPSWFGDLEAAERTADFTFPPERRAALVAALREQNGDIPALRTLAQPGAVAVVTGQQVGLFSGPAYTIFKALTAVKLAEHLTSRGIPAVPIFWLATEDHDLAEVDHAWVFDHNSTPRKLTAAAASSGGPVGELGPTDIPISELRESLGSLPYADAVVNLVETAYRPGVTLGAAFRSLLQTILASFGLLYIDPLAPSIRKIVSPFLESAAAHIGELIPALQARSRDLISAGYHAQVNIEADSSLLFALENGKRTPLRWNNGRLMLRGERTFEPGNGVTLSPNALLRPVMQDFLLPTIAYVGGPAEIAYLAQAEVLYRRLLGRMPLVYPRNGFTLLDERAAKIMSKYELQVTDLLDSCENVRGKIAAKLIPPSLADDIARLRATVDVSLQRLKTNLNSFDPTLEAAAGKSSAKILYQVDKIARKTARETLRRDERASENTSYLLNLVYPHRHLQERFYSILPFLAKSGLDLPKRLAEYTQLNCADHMVRIL
ncbi:MAG TPA: bacillithiol biosynthesis cysteine-adding enzyme BshC [Bryobacteraceae bacterium]|jgi:bacillithiol biosynthesis cysteine-adding enzyme BshC|nr:bacillithiol biosynthesis cysteine-adding enzyme BshC [Bryobacteraceae bacterium]